MKKLTQQILLAYKKSGQKWLDELPSLIQSLMKQWQLRDLVEYENLSWNYVAQGCQFDRPVVLKISYNQHDLKREVSALQVFTPGSCVEVIQFDEQNKAVLLETASPGKDLLSSEIKDPLKIIQICCDLAQNIQRQQNPHSFPFEPIKNLFKNFEKEWDIPEKMLLTARKLQKELISVEAETKLIHGDLHRGNILSHHNQWYAIDPKGYRGSLYDEVWPFIHDPELEIPWAAKRLGLDENQLLKWCFIHSILATTGCLENGVDSKNIFELAEKIFQLIK